MSLPCKHAVWWLAAMVAVTGCQKKGTSTRPTTAEAIGEIPADITMYRTDRSSAPATRAARAPGDPAPAADRDSQTFLGIDAYVISVPMGSVSRNEAFWKRVDEDEGIDAGLHRLLRANCIRVGQAKLDEWSFFKEIIDQRPATTERFNLVSLGGKPAEISVRKDVAVEHLFPFNPTVRGRTYDNCQNVWQIAYQAVPRSPDRTRITMSPLVRSQRKRLEVITHRAHPEDPPEQEIAYVYPEYPLDFAIEAELAPGSFLVVAPTADAPGGSVGEAFLTGESAGARGEKLMLLVPRQVAATIRAVQQKPLR